MANLRTNNLSGEQGQNAYRGSVFFSGDNDFLDISSSEIAAAIPGGDEPYTIEMWVQFGRGGTDTDSGGSDSLIAYGTNSTRSYNGIDWTGTAIRNVWYSDDLSYTVDLIDGAWHHIAATYDQTTRRLFVDGVLGASDTPSDHSVGTTNNGKIGASTGGVINRDFKGYISNLRITKRAIYTEAFTPPAQELTAVDDTMLLCCQDSDDASQEETGKTIIPNGSYRLDKGTGNLIVNGLDWDGAGSSYSTTMPTGWTAGNGAQVKYESGGVGGGGADRKLRLRNDGNNSFINQEIPTVIGQRYFYNVHLEAQNSGLGLKINAGTSSGDGTSLADSFNAGTDGTEARRTGFFIATATTTHFSLQIISGTDDASVFWDDVTVTPHNPITPKVIPPYGVDAGNTFGGTIQQSSQGYMYFPTGRTEERGRGRGLIAGGSSPNNNQIIEFINIQSQGNSIEFGDLVVAGQQAGASSSIRALFGMGGQASPGTKQNVIQFVTIATTGNATDFGDRTVTLNGPGGLANQTRGIFAGGGQPNPQSDVIDFVTIATTGNATDFGNMTSANKNPAGMASPTRGLLVHGGDPLTNVIDFITIASAGNAQDFADTTIVVEGASAASSTIRGIIAGGHVSPAENNTIQFVTIASQGVDASDFGDLTQARQESAGISNNIRACFASGGVPSSYNNIDFVTITTTGNAIDFGDTLTEYGYRGGASDSHGGLS